jgi:hypothetical protein
MLNEITLETSLNNQIEREDKTISIEENIIKDLQDCLSINPEALTSDPTKDLPISIEKYTSIVTIDQKKLSQIETSRLPYWGDLNFDYDYRNSITNDSEPADPKKTFTNLLLTKAILDKEIPIIEADPLDKEKSLHLKEEGTTSIGELINEVYPSLNYSIIEINKQISLALESPEKFQSKFKLKDKKDLTSKEYILSRGVNLAVIFGLLLTKPQLGNDQQNRMKINNKPYSEQITNIPISEEISEILPIVEEDSKEDFNKSILDIEEWTNYYVKDQELMREGYIVEAIAGAPMYLIPIEKGFSINSESDLIKIETIDKGYFEIEKTITISDGKNLITLGLIANTYGSELVSAMVLEAEDLNGNRINFAVESEDIENTVTYVALPENIYPNKIKNILTALAQISEFQENNDGFHENLEYSFLEIIGFKDPQITQKYVDGFNSSNMISHGGGICAAATGLSSLIHIHDQYDINTIEQWGHPTRYFQGPFSKSQYIVDATVDLSKTKDYDFRWVQSKDLYIRVDANIIPQLANYQKDPLQKPADAIFLLSLSFSKEPIPNQSTRIMSVLNNYYNNRGSSEYTTNIISGTSITTDLKDNISMIYNPEDIGLFQSEIDSSPVYRDILQFQKVVNAYDPDNTDLSFTDYLKTTGWYKKYMLRNGNEEIDTMLRMLSYTRIKGEPLQCVGYVEVLSKLYPELNIQYIGGAEIRNAKELIPPNIIGYQQTSVAATGFGGIAYSGYNIDIDDYESGDLFVITDGVSGHIGAIIAEIEDPILGTVLWMTDSNRLNDGKIRNFLIYDTHLEPLLGEPYRNIIRKNNISR